MVPFVGRAALRLRILATLTVATLALAACGSTVASASPAAVAAPSAEPSAVSAASAALPPSASPSMSAASPALSTAATTPAPAASFDSCTVVTQAEAGSALGQTVTPPVRGKATVEGGVACVFYGPSVPAGADPDIPVVDSVRVVLVTGPDALKFFNDYRSKVPAQAVAGLGDQAYFDGSASLSVLKGAAYLRVAVIGGPPILAAERKLAQDVLPRM